MALVALAACLVAAAGGTAIYAIHRTMPATGTGQAAPPLTSAPPAASAPPITSAEGDPAAPSPRRLPMYEPGDGAIARGSDRPRPPEAPVSLRPPIAPDPAERRTPRMATEQQPRAGTQGEPRTRAPAGRAEAPSRTGDGPAASTEVRSPMSPRSAAARLADAQAACSDEALVSRLICNERVRLRFCRERWNAHPDCLVETPKQDP